MTTALKTIGIAVVEHHGKFLVGTRGPDGPLAGFAEFPGGKCEPDETPAECACRECLEETGLAVEPAKLLQHCRHDYPHGAVELHFWHCRPARAESVKENHRGYRWTAASELSSMRFPEGNAAVIAMLQDARQSSSPA